MKDESTDGNKPCSVFFVSAGSGWGVGVYLTNSIMTARPRLAMHSIPGRTGVQQGNKRSAQRHQARRRQRWKPKGRDAIGGSMRSDSATRHRRGRTGCSQLLERKTQARKTALTPRHKTTKPQNHKTTKPQIRKSAKAALHPYADTDVRLSETPCIRKSGQGQPGILSAGILDGPYFPNCSCTQSRRSVVVGRSAAREL